MKSPIVVSIIPYRILPAKLGGEKGIALFNEYLGKLVSLTGVSTRNNTTEEARNYEMLNILSNTRFRYIDIFFYYKLKTLLKERKATHLITEHPYFAWLASLLHKRLPIAWVIHSHNIEYERSKSIGRWWWKALQRYETWAYKKADINFFISDNDRTHAVDVLKVPANKCHTVTYGVEVDSIPPDIADCKRKIRKEFNIAADEKIFLFNGALYHRQNYDALSIILKNINPLLIKKQLKYKIIVCGKGLPSFFNELIEYKDKNIIYAGFVKDISEFFKASDIFLNPILAGGGIKTKAIEAIAMNCIVVSTKTAASGINSDVCGRKLVVVNDHDWERFASEVEGAMDFSEGTPPQFYDYYYWGNIVKKVVDILKEKSPSQKEGL